MKNKFLLTLFTLVVLGGCSSIQEEEQEEPEVLLYKQSQDRINAKNYIAAVESLSRIERFYPFGVYAEQARADLIYAFYMTGYYDPAYAAIHLLASNLFALPQDELLILHVYR